MTTKAPSTDITRVVLAILLLGGLISTSYLVLKPFLLALIWASTIVISSWPLMTLIQRKLKSRRGLAAFIMTITLTIVLMVPLTVALSAIVGNIGVASNELQDIISHGVPKPPQWLNDIPLVGSKLVTRWENIASLNKEEALAKLSPFIGSAITWIVHQIGSVGLIIIHIVLTVILSGFLFAKGDSGAKGLMQFAQRLAPGRGEEVIILAGQAIRAVANGVILTALLQSVMAVIGLSLAGVPYAVLLSALIFLLSVIQIGAGPVFFAAIAWLFYKDETITAWAFLVWSILIMTADNFVRPFLIKRGADLPLILIFAGVIGGLLAFGVIGIFVGPVVLAVTYTLLRAWTNQGAVMDAK